MTTFSHRLEIAHRVWLDAGKPAHLLLQGLEADLARSWREVHLLNPSLTEFIEQSSADPEVEASLWPRAPCASCGDPFRLKNMWSCVECLRHVCYRCTPPGKRCRCQGEMY